MLNRFASRFILPLSDASDAPRSRSASVWRISRWGHSVAQSDALPAAHPLNGFS